MFNEECGAQALHQHHNLRLLNQVTPLVLVECSCVGASMLVPHAKVTRWRCSNEAKWSAAGPNNRTLVARRNWPGRYFSPPVVGVAVDNCRWTGRQVGRTGERGIEGGWVGECLAGQGVFCCASPQLHVERERVCVDGGEEECVVCGGMSRVMGGRVLLVDEGSGEMEGRMEKKNIERVG